MKLSIHINLALFYVSAFSFSLVADTNPHQFIDQKSQQMVDVIVSNSELFASDPLTFKQKVKDIFEPMVDFKRVGAMVMGRKYYNNASFEERNEFIEVFKTSLLDTYAETLAQWGDQKIETVWPLEEVLELPSVVDVDQRLITSNNVYPITYKVRNNGSDGWQIVNIIINGVNLGLTFRNQFEALALENNNDISKVISNWSSDIEV
ncbi:MAG: ABC transporter substrate-binding protein [Gammaproteobacteria bacterium]